MKTLTKPPFSISYREHFAVPRKSEACWPMAARDRDDVGTCTVEIAFNVRAFAATAVRNS